MNSENTFIPDKELDLLEKEDLLGTSPYVDVLYDTVKHCNTPFNIGLLGGWGSGKSTIVRTLKSKLDQDNGIDCFIYDAWKYSQDSFRRTFILQLKRHFDLKISEKEKKEFYADKNEQLESRVGTIKDWWKVAVILLIPLMIYFAISYFASKSIGLTEFVTSILFVAIMAFLSKVFVTYSVDFTKPKIFASEEFEEKFEGTLERIFEKQDLDKLLIVVDNIDRCHDELVIELLLTIKNFLGKDNTVFLLPIDEDGVKNFLQDTNQDENEFLRKILNTNLKMKKFSNNELFDFSKKICDEYGLYELGVNDPIVNIASKEYARNPRKLIQFFNNLQSEIRIAKIREQNGQIPDGSVTGNLEFLAKIVIIRQEWPDLYQKVFDKPWLLKKITQFINSDRYTKGEQNNVKFGENGIPDLNENKFRFFSRTKGITVENVEPFLVNKDIYKDIPDEIDDLIESSDWNEIKKHIEQNNLEFSRLVEILNDKFDVTITKRGLYSTSGLWLFSLSLKIINDEDFIDQFEKYYEQRKFRFLDDLIKEKKFKEHLLQTNFKSLVKATKWFYDKGNKLYVNKIIGLFNFENKAFTSSPKSQLFKEVINVFQDYSVYIKRLEDPFSSFVEQDLSQIGEFRETLRDTELADTLLSFEVRKNLADSINDDINDKINVFYINLLNRLTIGGKNPSDISRKLNEKYFKYLKSFDQSTWQELRFWTAQLKYLIPYFKSINSKKDILSDTTNYLVNQYKRDNTGSEQLAVYKNYLDLLKKCFESDNGYKNTSLNDLNTFFQVNNSDEIIIFTAKIYQDLLSSLNIWPPTGHVIQKIDLINSWDKKEDIYDLCDLMIKKSSSDKGLNDNQKQKILNKYIQELLTNKNDDIILSQVFFHIRDLVSDWGNKQIMKRSLNNITNRDEIRFLISKADLFDNNRLLRSLPYKFLKQVNNPNHLSSELEFVENNISDDVVINDTLLKVYQEKNDSDQVDDLDIAALIFQRNNKGRKTDVNNIVDDFEVILKSENKSRIYKVLGLLTLLDSEDIYKNRKEWLIPLLRNLEITDPGAKNNLRDILKDMG